MQLDFGSFWNQHLTTNLLREATSWYRFHEPLRSEILGYKPNDAHDAPLGKIQFAKVRAAVIQYAEASVAAYNLPYHNMEHFADFAKRIVKLFDEYYGKAAATHLALRQVLELAAWTHDCWHTGCTFRADSVHPLYMPELGTDVSAEYVSAIATDRLFVRLGLPLPWRVMAVVFIWDTTFAGLVAAQRGIRNIPAIGIPNNLVFKFGHVADIWTPDDIVDATKKAIAVNVLELPATGRLSTALEVAKGQVGFERHRSELLRVTLRACNKPMPSLFAARERSKLFAQTYQEAIDGKRPGLMNLIENCMP